MESVGTISAPQTRVCKSQVSVLVIGDLLQLENVARVESRTSHKNYVLERTEIKACNTVSGAGKITHFFRNHVPI